MFFRTKCFAFILLANTACGSGTLVAPAGIDAGLTDLLFAATVFSPPRAVAGEAAPTRQQRLRGIWLVGGYNGSEIVNHTDLYDPETNQYYADAAPPLNLPRSFLALTSLGGKLYAVGGITAGGSATRSVEVLDPGSASPTWTNAADLVSPRINPGIAVVDGRIFVLGGSNVSTPNMSGDIEVMVGSTWSGTTYADLTFADQRLDGGIAGINSIIYLTGGRDGIAGRIWPINGYVPAASNGGLAQMTFAMEPQMSAMNDDVNEARWGVDAAATANENLPATVFIVGGIRSGACCMLPYPVAQNTLTPPSPYVSIFQTSSGAFSPGRSLNQPRAFARAIALGGGTNPGLYVLGGSTSGGLVNGIEYMRITGNTIGNFSLMTNLAHPRYGFGASIVEQ